VQSLGDHLVFLGIQTGGHGVLLIGCGGMGFGGGYFGEILCNMPRGAAEKTKLVVQMALVFLRCQFTIFA